MGQINITTTIETKYDLGDLVIFADVSDNEINDDIICIGKIQKINYDENLKQIVYVIYGLPGNIIKLIKDDHDNYYTYIYGQVYEDEIKCVIDTKFISFLEELSPLNDYGVTHKYELGEYVSFLSTTRSEIGPTEPINKYTNFGKIINIFKNEDGYTYDIECDSNRDNKYRYFRGIKEEDILGTVVAY